MAHNNTYRTSLLCSGWERFDNTSSKSEIDKNITSHNMITHHYITSWLNRNNSITSGPGTSIGDTIELLENDD